MLVVGDGELALGKLFLCLKDKEIFFIARYAVIRHKSNAKTDPRKVDEKVIACQLDLRNKVKLVLLEYLMDEFVCGAVLVKHQDRIVQKLGEGKRFSFQLKKRLPGDKHITELFDPHSGRRGAEIIVRIVDYDQIHQSVLQETGTLHGSLVDDLDMRARESSVKTLQIRDEEIAADRVAGSDPYLPSGGSRVEKLCLPFLDEVHGRFDMAHEDLSLRGKPDLLRTADEKGLIQFPLQCFDGLADRRLGDKEAFGRLGKIQGRSDMVKNLV